MMPIMDGYQLLDRLKADQQLNNLPVIMLTARADKDDRLRALRMGVDDYIVKPFVEEELLVRIDNLLKNYQQRQKSIGTETAKPTDLGNESYGIIEEGQESRSSISKYDLEWLAELEEHIKSHLSEPNFTLEILSLDLAMSERQIRRKVKKLVGLSPNQYIRKIRLNTAREILLSNKERSVKAVSLSVGFKRADYFSNLYYRRFGKRPSEYVVK